MFMHSFIVVVHVHDVVFRDSKPLMSGSPNVMINQHVLLFTWVERFACFQHCS